MHILSFKNLCDHAVMFFGYDCYFDRIKTFFIVMKLFKCVFG